MGLKLYVGGLPYSYDKQALEDLFSAAGSVTSATIISDRETGRSKGFGFVEMSTEAEATAAIDQFNGKEVDGRTITVNEARPQEDRPRNGGFRGGNGGGNRGRGNW
jgi:cold-inducible RNA-binding protein